MNHGIAFVVCAHHVIPMSLSTMFQYCTYSYIILFTVDMDYIPPDSPQPEAEADQQQEDPEDDLFSGDDRPAKGGCGSAAAGGVLYSRLRLILQSPEPSEAVNA